MNAVRWPVILISLSLPFIFAGCAAERTYREGRELAASGQRQEALEKFEAASRLDKGSAQYKIATITMREALVNEALSSGDSERAAGNRPAALAAYRRATELHPANARALAGMRALDTAERHDKWLQLAQTAVTQKDKDSASFYFRQIITEDPKHIAARVALRALEMDAVRPVANASLSQKYRKPITIEFKDAQLKSIFDVISRTSGLNFLFDKDVKTDQKTSIYLRNSTIEAALNMTLLTNQLEQRVIDENSVLIYPNTAAKLKDYQPLTVKGFYLSNAEAKGVANTLKSLLKVKDVVVDDKLNLLILRDSPETIRLAEKLVLMHDVAEPEVMLEVEILEVKRTRLLDMGIRWPDQLSLAPLAATTGAALTVNDLKGLSGGTLGATLGVTTLTAKLVETDANILANPRIRARNREKAKILIGERVPNITTTATATGFVSESVNYVDVGLKLDVEPTVFPDDEVAIKISMEVSNIISQLQTKSGSIAYQIGTRSAQTVLRLKNGETQVLAGLINDEDRSSANRVPGLGSIPIAGRLFGGQADNSTKTEIVLSITPRVLRNVLRPDATVMEFESGTETSLGSRAGGAGTVSNAGLASPPKTDAQSNSANTNAQRPLTGQSGAAQGTNLANTGSTLAAAGSVGTGISTNSASQAAPVTGNVRLQWQGPTQLKVGDTFTAQLGIQADQAISGLPLSIGFDARSLQALSVVEGDFLKQGGAVTNFVNNIDPAGQIQITATRTGEVGAIGSGTFAALNFKVIAAPVSITRIQVLSVSPAGIGGRAISAPLPLPQEILLSQP